MSEIRKMIILSLCLAVSPLGGAFADENVIPEAVKVSDVQDATSLPAQSKNLSVRMDGGIQVSGLSIMKSPEGEIRTDVIDGIPCFRSTCGNGKPGYVYLLAEEWGKLLKWRGEMKGLELQIRLFDAEPGKLGISYDSSDLKLKRDPYPVGTWRTPDAGDFKLTGDKKWKTASFKLEQAFFNRRLNGGDIRIGNSNAKSAIAWIALVPSNEEATQKPPVPMRLSVARVSAPEGKDLKNSGKEESQADLWTSSIRPFDVANWGKIEFKSAGELTNVEYSVDGGSTWAKSPPSGDLSSIPCRGGGKDSIQFHFVFDGKDTPPTFIDGSLVYKPGKADFKSIEDKSLRIDMNAYGILNIFDKTSGKTVSSAPASVYPFASLMVKKTGPSKANNLDLYDASFDGIEDTGTPEAPAITLRHSLKCGIKLATSLKLSGAGQAEWTLNIDNPTDLEVCEIRFPIVSGIKLGGDASDDIHYTGVAWKQEVEDSLNPGLRFLGSGGSMRWTAIYDKAQCLYLGIEDERLDDWDFAYGCDRDGGAYMGAMQRILVKPGSTWRSATYRMALTDGGWHKAADIYKDRTADKLSRCDVPPNTKWSDGWVHGKSDNLPAYGWDSIDTQKNFFGEFPSMMSDNRQMLDGADAAYCGVFPYPSPVWGSMGELRQKLALRKAMGGTWLPYLNLKLFAPGYTPFQRIGTFPKRNLPSDIPMPDEKWYAKATMHEYDGSYVRCGVDPFFQVNMALGSREWQDWLAYWTKRYVEWGAGGMYYDQTNMVLFNGNLQPDYPDTYGCWARGTLDTLKKIKSESRKVDPRWTSSGELCNDVYGQQLDMHMTSGVFEKLDYFRYCNPSQIVQSGTWNGAMSGDSYGDRWRYVWQLGARFDDDAKLRPEIVSLRRAVKSLLYDADYKDTVDLETLDASGTPLQMEDSGNFTSARGTGARWFLYKSGIFSGAIVNIINAASSADGKSVVPVKGATASINTKAFGPVTCAVAWTIDGNSVLIKGKQNGDIYSFPIPESEISSVVLSKKLPPIVDWKTSTATTTNGTACSFTVKITNVNNEPLSGSAKLRLPNGWETPVPMGFGPLKPAESATLEIPFRVPQAVSIRGTFDVWCDISSDSGEFKAYGMLTVCDPVLVDFRGNPGNYRIWLKNLSDKMKSGSLELSAPSPLKALAPSTFEIPPSSETEIPVTLDGQEALTQIAEMSAVIKIDGKEFKVLRGVIPQIPNPGFESDCVGDMKPDWWMCRTKKKLHSYQKIALSNDAHSGTHSLRLDPPEPGNEMTFAYPVNGGLKPGTKYKLSVWIKSEASKGIYAVTGSTRLGDGKTEPEWKLFEKEFTNTGSFSLRLYNYSDKPAFFDDLKVEEVK